MVGSSRGGRDDGWGRDLAEASDFAPAFGSVADAARLVAGEGFWNGAFQVARDIPVLSALAGVVLLAAALFGTVRVPSGIRVALCTLAGISFVVAVSSAVPGLSSLADAISRSALGAPLRDTQRALVPFLLWLAVAAGLGADRLLGVRSARSWAGSLLAVAGVLPLVAAILLAVPAAWGFGGELRPVRLPPEWAQARAEVDNEPGTVLALPWFQYYTLDVARDRLTLGIAPYYFGGDVIAASDPRLTVEHREEITDPRYTAIDGVVEAARDGRPVSDELAAVGVRWVVLQHDVDWQSYTGVAEDPDLELVVSGPTLDLYRVTTWPGPGVAADGTPADVDPIVSPVAVRERVRRRHPHSSVPVGLAAGPLDRHAERGWTARAAGWIGSCLVLARGARGGRRPGLGRHRDPNVLRAVAPLPHNAARTPGFVKSALATRC